VIDNDDAALTPKNQLRGTLVDFGYDARSSSVVVTYDAIRDVNGTQVRTRRFSATVPGVAPEAAPVGAALNQAANQVASEVADWVG
jgi:cholesterol transport system auxiliary component